VGYVSLFLEEPHEEHLGAVKHIVRYVAARTNDWGLWFRRKKEDEENLIGFSDSDYAGDGDERQSTTGVILIFADLHHLAVNVAEDNDIIKL
jgi:hypothetical protein